MIAAAMDSLSGDPAARARVLQWATSRYKHLIAAAGEGSGEDRTRPPATPRLERLTWAVAEVAQSRGVSRDLVNDLIAAGRLRSVKTGGRRLIPADALEEFLASRDGWRRSAALPHRPDALPAARQRHSGTSLALSLVAAAAQRVFPGPGNARRGLRHEAGTVPVTTRPGTYRSYATWLHSRARPMLIAEYGHPTIYAWTRSAAVISTSSGGQGAPASGSVPAFPRVLGAGRGDTVLMSACRRQA
jgi:excisionase family DNA binding protein